MTSAVIAGYARTPFHFAYKGNLKTVRPMELAATAVKGVLDKSGINKDDIEDLILGCSFPEAEQGFNMARLVVFASGLGRNVGGMTINRFCGSPCSLFILLLVPLPWVPVMPLSVLVLSPCLVCKWVVSTHRLIQMCWR